MSTSPASFAIAASVVIHLVGGTLLWAFGAGGERTPMVRSIRVDIVSPPPNEAGEPPATPPSPAAAVPEPEPEATAPEPAAEVPPPPPPPAPPSSSP
ncbi:MAG: hypothetical protein M3483_06945, partial [Gemmatimonadota bacterium]|nr:hypothetical protein [Gemmatimonadota bacterium]